jgi:hypothetical protein
VDKVHALAPQWLTVYGLSLQWPSFREAVHRILGLLGHCSVSFDTTFGLSEIYSLLLSLSLSRSLALSLTLSLALCQSIKGFSIHAFPSALPHSPSPSPFYCNPCNPLGP